MCGICGYVHTDRRPVPGDEVLRRMALTLALRGPDDEGYFVKGCVALGHRRLSIIDLERGHQPMTSEDGKLALVYNGEVYNFQELKEELIKKGHTFTTRADSEVVLKAYAEWGHACLERFNGMFALAIWDGRDESLFLARDRFGKKPLYYGAFGRTFVFGSELKAVFQHPDVRKEIDPLALRKYFAHDYIPCPRTIMKGISKLEPGCFAVVKDGEVKKGMYWDFRFDPDAAGKLDFQEAKRTLVGLLRESVRRRLVSDVPLGVFLSGGIDSSAIVAVMSTLMPPKEIKTFSIGFTDRSYDEAGAARLIAQRFGTDHHEKIVDPDLMLKVLPRVVEIIDEPFADSSIIPTYVVSQFARERVKVVLGGDGGDELFMGYVSFVAHRIADYYTRVPAFGQTLFERLSRLLPGKSDYLSLHFKAQRFFRGLRFPPDIRHQVWIGSFTPSDEEELFAGGGDGARYDSDAIYSESKEYFHRHEDLPFIDKVEYLYIKTYLVDDILTKVDRASMATSLEVRAPFLDSDIAEFSGKVPSRFKLRGLTTKYILKEAFKGILPEETLTKPKHGFAVPVGRWFRSELKGLLTEVFEKGKIEREGMFDHAYIARILDGHFSGRMDNSRKIWALLVYEMWYNKWMKGGSS